MPPAACSGGDNEEAGTAPGAGAGAVAQAGASFKLLVGITSL